jgi:hypothetical protein
MSLDDALVAALQDSASTAAQSVDTVRARAAVEARWDRVDRRRRRRIWLVPVAVGAVAAAVIIVIAGRGLREAASLPPAHPSPTPTATTFALPADPFMTDSEVDAAFPTGAFARDTSSSPHQLNPCLSDPRGWGAAQVMAATYRSRITPTVTLNEYVLRFADAGSAHRALLAGWTGLNSCQSGNQVNPLSDDGGRFDDYFVDQDAHASTPGGRYELFVTRVGMVVVLVEDTDFPRDESGPATHFLNVPLARAIPGYFDGYTPDCVENPQPCPDPTSFG